MPNAIGIIMDGNRRWAKERGLPTFDGHQKGFEKLQEVVAWARKAGVKELTVYAFSTENWNRAPEEVSYLMGLLETMLNEGLEKVAKEGRIRFIGERTRFSEKVQQQMRELEGRTSENTAGTLVVALSYGGRAEIIDAVQKLSMSGEVVSEASLRSHMWSADLLDPELIIRTGGEMRLSNFLTWQSVYSELMFTPTLWPDFEKEEFLSLLSTYETRERRMGK